MHLQKLCVRNFRRLRSVVIDLASDISIFVGANNSGKTSVGHALQLFTAKAKFSLHDFSVDLWPQFNAFGNNEAGAALPTMSIDIWLEVTAADLHRVVDLLPNLDWQGTLVGMRVAYVPVDPEATRQKFRLARERALAAIPARQADQPPFDPSPRNLHEFLEKELHKEYELRYFVLDPARFDAEMQPLAGYQPSALQPNRDRSGRDVLNSLIRIDCLHAQRHLSDSAGGARAEDLSRVLSRFYERNLEQKADDIDALQALANSEASLNDHLQRVFEPTLRSLAKLGYPGLTNPRLVIKTALEPTTIMNSREGARVHYAVGAASPGLVSPTLPDRYNGLGFKNLIFMVVELLDLHAQWLAIQENRPPLHLVFIEEPEAHLHAQLQQAFIRKVLDILQLSPEDQRHYRSQVVVTTHSAHILYERGFRPIRYFRRSHSEEIPSSRVLNLSRFYDGTVPEIRNFLERYLRLTHCDLFFADAAVLVEGNVERLLLPQMIDKAAARLQSTYLSILEIGGAYGYRFKALIDFIGITALVITDLDSVYPPAPGAVPAPEPAEGAEEEDDEQGDGPIPRRACLADFPGAHTSNQTLIQWLPRQSTTTALFAASPQDKTQARQEEEQALVRVAYQCPTPVTWGGETRPLAGRTLEEAFALENLAWTQDLARASLLLRIPRPADKDLSTLAERIHKRVKGAGFKKTDFALALLSQNPDDWQVPAYIAQGLQWLEAEVAPSVANPPAHAGAANNPAPAAQEAA